MRDLTRSPDLPITGLPLQWLAAAVRWAGLAALVLFAAANLVMAGVQIALIVWGSAALDWLTYVASTERIRSGDLYLLSDAWDGWRYSPLAEPLFALIAPLGLAAWRLLHLSAALAMPGRARFLALASYPFWFDVHAGNFMIFVALAAAWALRGNRVAIAAFLVLTLLVPRPLMIPVAAWLLLRNGDLRLPFAAATLLYGVVVLATGYADEWLTKLLTVGATEMTSAYNVAPSAIIGPIWLAIAIPLAVWAFRAGRPGLSGLLLQPYWLPYYLLIVLADEVPPRAWWVKHLTPFGSRASAADQVA
jgi:hypothetical protein